MRKKDREVLAVHRSIGVFLMIVLSMSLVTCTEVIDLRIGESNQELVIFGRVTDGTAGNEVEIAFTSTASGEQEPVSGARVSLMEDGQLLGTYTERSPGFYRLELPNDSARTGRTYHLEVAIGTNTYRSTAAVMPDLAAVDSTYIRQGITEVVVNEAGISVERKLIEFVTDTEIVDPDRDYFLKWHLVEAYGYQERIRITPLPRPPCFITNDITGQEVALFDGSSLKVPRIQGQVMSRTEIDTRFAFDYYMTVVQTTVDQSTYDYWNELNLVSNRQGSIFDPPPAPVAGNIANVNDPDEVVLGYFEVARSDTTRVRIRNTDLTFRVFLPCPAAEASREPTSCINCLLIENSTYHRPYYWFD